MTEPNRHSTPQQKQDSAVVFISYAREDQGFASRLDESLRLKGVSVRGDWQLVRGEDYQEQLRALMLESDSLIFIISPDSARSPACLDEVARAVEQRKRVLPVVCRDYDGELPAALRSPQWTFLREGDDFVAGVQELIAAANTDFDLMSEHRRLLAAAETWQRNNRSRSFLLRKDGLKKAVVWLARTSEHPNKLPKPTSLQSEYILASQHAQTRGARVAFGIAGGVVMALAILAVVAWTQRGFAKQNEKAALDNAAEAQRQRTTAETNAAEAERQAGIASDRAAEAERQRQQADENAEEAKKNAKEAERQAGIAKTNEQTAKTQQRLAEERRVEAERQRRLAEDRALEERGARAAILAQRPGREFEALAVALEAAGSSLKSHGDVLPAVIGGLGSAVGAAKYSFPLRGHSGGVTSAAFSRDGSRLLTVDENGVARLWDTGDGRLVASWKVIPWNHNPPAVDTATAFSRDGKSLVTMGAAYTDYTAVIRDVQTGEPLVTLRGHTDTVTSAAFSPDGTRVVTSSGPSDGTARVWDARTGKQLVVTSSGGEGYTNGQVSIVAFSPDGERLVTAHQDNAGRLWDARTGKLLKTFQGVGGLGVNAAAFAPDGTRVLIGGALCDTITGECSPGARMPSPYTTGVISPDGGKFLFVSGHYLYLNDSGETKAQPAPFGKETERHRGDINFAAFSPDGKRIVTASQDRTARVWDASSGEMLMTLEAHTDRVRFAAFSPDGRYIVTAGMEGTARIWDTHADRSLATLEGATGQTRWRQFAAVSPDAAAVVIAGHGNTALLWDVRAGRQRALLEGHAGEVVFAAFSPDGTRLITSSKEQTILRDASTGMPLAAPVEGRAGADEPNAFSPDSGRFITFNGRELLVWDARAGGLITRQKNSINSAGFSPDGRFIYAFSESGQEIDIYDARSFKYLRVLLRNGPYQNFISFSPDGKRVVTKFLPDKETAILNSGFRTAQVWAVDTGKPLFTLEGHTAEITFATFSPDGALIVTASKDGTARIWDSSNGRQIGSLESHTGVVVSAMFSPDGRYVVTAGRDDSDVRADYTARLWDARSGKQLAVLLGHTASINSAAFAPDGRYVITASSDGTAKIYSAVESDLLREYFTGGLNLLRFQKEFDAVREFEQYLVPRQTLGGQPSRP